MSSLEKVLDCCRYHWEQPRDIARRYDELYPPKWYEFFRRWYMSGIPNSPSVMLHVELSILHDHDLLDFKIEGRETVIAPDGKAYHFVQIWYKLKHGGRRVRKETRATFPVLQSA